MNAFLFFSYGIDYWGVILFIILALVLNAAGIMLAHTGNLPASVGFNKIGSVAFYAAMAILVWWATDHIGWINAMGVVPEAYMPAPFVFMTFICLIGWFTNEPMMRTRVMELMAAMMVIHALWGVIFILQHS